MDEMNTICAEPKYVEWMAPDKMAIDLDDSNGVQVYKILKGAMDYLHKQIEVRVSTSKDLYKKSENTWKELRDLQLDKCRDRATDIEQFSLDKKTVLYILNKDTLELVDIIDLKHPEKVTEFKNTHKKFKLSVQTVEGTKKFFSEVVRGLVKFVFYDAEWDITGNDYTPIIIMECNNTKSIYKVHSGIFIYKDFTFVPAISSELEDNKLSDFIMHFDLKTLLDYSTDQASEYYEQYKNFNANPIEISVRELTKLFTRAGFKIKLDNADNVQPLDMTDETNDITIQDFFNTFTYKTGETAYDIMKLSELKKSFRYNDLTLINVLKILSKEYLTSAGGGVTAELLGDIVYKLIDLKSADKEQTDTIKKEVK